MKVAIDGYEANVLQRLGSSQVAFELLRTLEKIDLQNNYTVLLPSAPLDDLPPERDGWRYKILMPKKLWTKITLPWYLYTTKDKYDVIFSPTHYISMLSPIKRVVTIFDLAFLYFPEMFTNSDLWQLKSGTNFSVKNADHIITISNSTKKDIIKSYRVDKDKITVSYPGFDSQIFRPLDEQKVIKQVLDKYSIEGDYIIYIGTIQPRKNISRLIEAVAEIDDLKLVVVGKTTGQGRNAWMFEDILKKPQQLGIEDRVIFTGFAPTEDLPYLINGAQAYLLVSLYEGFGIPLLEAMACGVPVIASNVSSMPEVVNGAGLLVDPHSVDQIEQAIRTIITDKKLRQKKIRLGLKQSEKFSWNKMAKTVLNVLERYKSQV